MTGTSSSSGGSTDAGSTTPANNAPAANSNTPAPPLAARQNLAPALPTSGTFDLSGMFLTTGLAALTALWFSIYILIATLVRFWAYKPPSGELKQDSVKRFCYRLTRALLVVNVVLLPSLILDVVVKANQFRGNEGLVQVVGGGVARESICPANPSTC